MEILIVVLIVIIIVSYLKIRNLQRHLTVLSFSGKLVNKLLIKKGIITPSEIDIITNEAIGDIPEEDGNEIIKSAKSIGITIPEYMDDEKLKKYVKTQEFKRMDSQISYTDRMTMSEEA